MGIAVGCSYRCDMGYNLNHAFFLWIKAHGVIEGSLNGGAIFGFNRPEVQSQLVADLGIGLWMSIIREYTKGQVMRTHDHSFEIEAAIVIRSSAYGLKRLFS